MTNRMEKSLWITSVSTQEVSGEKYIPTAIYYTSDNKPLIGKSAVKESSAEFTTNFKVELGNIIPGGSTTNRRTFKTPAGKKTAFEISKDYLDTLLSEPEEQYPKSEQTNYKHPAKIIVAEPLSFQIDGFSKQWLSNYRANIRRILDRYEQVEFLPEPFAVYQYYRYGLRLTSLQEKAKQIALILDFGGGTFDACIIESTHTGDISQSGKSSKPLSAASVPVGGFYINNRIAIYLIKRHLDDRQKQIADKYIEKYYRVLRGELELSILKEECQTFIENLIHLERLCEDYKLDLVSKLSESDWNLNAEAYQKISVSVPENPFQYGRWIEVDFLAHNLREIFVTDIWNKHLKDVVTSVIKRSEEYLDDRHITITLISGGSSNLRWLMKLLARDFPNELFGAEPVPVSHSFQEIVANGLAIECARRFYNEDSEFVAVTYNPIKLHLNPDGKGIESSKRYKSINDKIDMTNAEPGDLVPSAQSLRHFFGEELSWRVKLKRPPKQYLEYYFTRPDASDNDHTDSYNVEETRLTTRDSRHFDSHLTTQIQ